MTTETPAALGPALATRGARMNRRCFLAMTGGLWLLLTGHSPYRQWEVYRKVRLIVVANAEDEASVRLGQAIAGLLAKHLPDSRAMMARARDLNDLVRLVATKQLDAALMREEDAWIALRGTGRFADNGKVPFRTLAPRRRTAREVRGRLQRRESRSIPARTSTTRTTRDTEGNAAGSSFALGAGDLPPRGGGASTARRRPRGANARARGVSPHSVSRKARSCLLCSAGNALYRLVTPAA